MDPSVLALVVLFGLALVGGVWWISVLLTRVSAEGGAIDGDSTEIANQILAESEAFRGGRSADSKPWDGENRLAAPTQDGGFG
jgi:hypothetical protein